MQEILIRGAAAVVTMDDARAEVAGGDVLIRGGEIAMVGRGLTTTGDVLDAGGCVVTPGLVNTHHHLFQTLTRAVPGGQDALLFGWLKTLYPIWARMGPEEINGEGAGPLGRIRRWTGPREINGEGARPLGRM